MALIFWTFLVKICSPKEKIVVECKFTAVSQQMASKSFLVTIFGQVTGRIMVFVIKVVEVEAHKPYN